MLLVQLTHIRLRGGLCGAHLVASIAVLLHLRLGVVFRFYNEATMELHAEGTNEIVFANSSHQACGGTSPSCAA